MSSLPGQLSGFRTTNVTIKPEMRGLELLGSIKGLRLPGRSLSQRSWRDCVPPTRGQSPDCREPGLCHLAGCMGGLVLLAYAGGLVLAGCSGSLETAPVLVARSHANYVG